MVARRKSVTWKDPVSRMPVALPMPHLSEVQLPPELLESYSSRLTVGSLWTLRTDLKVESNYPSPRFKQHEFPYVDVASYYDPVRVAPAGSMAVYTGTVRVEETSNHNRIVSCLRHSFLITGSRYLTRDLGLFTPAT